ncbi:hypothetical protein NIES4101_28550 [Calothrix sp. NIES-4101]|nr:hypothetical protein NIES4101_28550 [Calothrix sp. NIES-4101]
MSQITIMCRLVANESTRQQLWQLMAELNTPLINELLVLISQHQDFETWQQKGKIPAGTVKQLCESLKTDPGFAGQPARFYASAIATVSYVYKAWMKVQKRLKSQLESKARWLSMLQSDEELIAIAGVDLDGLRNQARLILQQFAPEPSPQEDLQANKKQPKTEKSLSQTLLDTYESSEDILTRCAISYLLKNGCKVYEKPENSQKFSKHKDKLKVQIQRLIQKLEGRVPQGRNLTDTEWLETLILATEKIPQDEAEAKSWQDSLLKKSSSVIFPVSYESNEDMTWFRNQKGRICIKFNGISEHTFEIYCDSRQLHWFERFLSDQETKKNSKNQHSSALFTLRSARIGWHEQEIKNKQICRRKPTVNPWDIYHLTLYCTVDTRLWTAEGTAVVAAEKAEEIAKIITKTKEKDDLNEKQLAHIKRKNSTLERINNPYPRPSKPLYQANPHILVGVSLGLKKPATIAVVDVISQKVLTYCSIKQLLGKNYKLLNRHRQLKHNFAHKRKIAQTQAKQQQYLDSELGQYIDRLLAKQIIAIAKQYSASSIVLPQLNGMREQINSEIQAKAKEKCPESIEAQKKYAKQYRRSINQWSYGRLIESIISQGLQAGIAIEESKQAVQGSPQEKAKELAFVAYNSRKKS